MGVLFLLRAPGEACGTAKSSFGEGRGEASSTRAPFHPIITENAISERSISFRSSNIFLRSSSGFDISRDMYPFKCQSCFLDRIFPFVFLLRETNRDY